MQFNQGADMNTATIDMRENLDAISAQWEDSIGSPTIMKMNPDMMPIMVAAVDSDKIDNIALSEKMEKETANKFEEICKCL